jgi:Protein kinase domain/WD40-like Beta Propeller Repeat
MTPERWQQVARVYQSAIEQEPSTRGAYVASACGDDTELRREVESLLAQPSAPGVIDRPLVDVAAHAFGVVTNLERGTMVGPYRIVGPIGEGGMGQVYRAQDTKLPRKVALKILPEAFVHDADRLARFRQEAHVLASLSHPNIATIHGFEDSAGVHALVLELVEGPTLADRIARGPLPLDEALPIRPSAGKPVQITNSPANETDGRFSPDGRWFAYVTDQSGETEVYLRAFDPEQPGANRAPAMQVSIDGGSRPHWRADGKELFFEARRQVFSVPIATQPALTVGKPQMLFSLPEGSFDWDVTRDGQRFLLVAPVGDYVSPPFTVLLNWQTDLGK